MSNHSETDEAFKLSTVQINTTRIHRLMAKKKKKHFLGQTFGKLFVQIKGKLSLNGFNLYSSLMKKIRCSSVTNWQWKKNFWRVQLGEGGGRGASSISEHRQFFPFIF